MLRLYGIANCDTVKKARKWLAEHCIDVEFIDFKKLPPDEKLLQYWIQAVGVDRLVNKRGTTWRQLPAEERDVTTDCAVCQLMMRYPSVIKRPILDYDGRIIVGFQVADYATIFQPQN